MRKFQVVLRLAEQTVLELIAYARNYVTKTTGNSNVTTPDPPLADTTTKTDDLETANNELIAAKNLVAEKVALVELKRKAVEDNLRIASRQINTIANGDKSIIESTGLDASDEPSPVYMPIVEDLSLTRGDDAGEVDSHWHAVKKSQNYTVQTSATAPDAHGDAPWVNYATLPTKSSITLTGFTSGSPLWVRVRANGRRDHGGWSDPAFIIVP